MAYSHPQQGHSEESKELRKAAGEYLKKVREKADLTQSALAKLLQIEYYTMISQIENGKARLPPDKMQDWAMACRVEPKDFAKTLLRFYDPFMWKMIFGRDKS